ncbi:MAG: hypothetical protein ACYSTG_11380 [Planctomycetota bacterium]|jgi:nitrate/TMAO reductase-like tetraheme cytochrome c subunit
MKSLKSAALGVLTATSAIALIITAGVRAEQAPTKGRPQLKEYRIDRTVSKDAKECIDCHAKESGGLVADWAKSRHAHANVTCLDCHAAGPADMDVSKDHSEYDKSC